MAPDRRAAPAIDSNICIPGVAGRADRRCHHGVSSSHPVSARCLLRSGPPQFVDVPIGARLMSAGCAVLPFLWGCLGVGCRLFAFSAAFMVRLSPALAGLFRARAETSTLREWYYSPMSVTVCFSGASFLCAVQPTVGYYVCGFAGCRKRQAHSPRPPAPAPRRGFFMQASPSRRATDDAAGRWGSGLAADDLAARRQPSSDSLDQLGPAPSGGAFSASGGAFSTKSPLRNQLW